jgi:hypothetical protein
MNEIKSKYLVEAKYSVYDYFSVPYDLDTVHNWYIRNRQLWIKVQSDSVWEQFVSDGDKEGNNHDEMKFPDAQGITQGELDFNGDYLFGEYLVMQWRK